MMGAGNTLRGWALLAWFMVQRLRESWKRLAGLDRMEDPVGIDGTLVGGLEKNKHVDKKRQKVAAVGAKG